MLSEPKSDFSDYIFSIILHIVVAGGIALETARLKFSELVIRRAKVVIFQNGLRIGDADNFNGKCSNDCVSIVRAAKRYLIAFNCKRLASGQFNVRRHYFYCA